MVNTASTPVPAAAPTDLRSLAVAALASRPQDRRLRWALTAFAVGGAGWQQAKQLREKVRTRRSWRIAVNGDDDIYDDVHAWLLAQIPPGDQRVLTARTKRGDRLELASPDGKVPATPLRLAYDDRGRQSVTLAGHTIDVELERPENSRTPQSDEYRRYLKELERLVFTTYSTEGRDAVIDLLASITDRKYASDRRPEFHMSTRWGDFVRRSDIPSRPLESVVLREGQKERLIEDLQRFRDDEDMYVRLGMPYHRGYMLHGPPGTGKTSLAKVIASHFGMDVYFIPLADLQADASLMNLVAGVRPGAMLLLEDIDVLHAATSRDEQDKTLSLSGLLNSLDGVSTPHGLVTVMTTNDLTKLDPALTRPGRSDVLEEVGYVDDHQLAGLFDMFYAKPCPRALEVRNHHRLTPADVVEVFKQHPKDRGAAAAAIAKRLRRG